MNVYSQKEIVPSGSFVVEKSTPKILKAFLGTCVGLALYDPVARIGGLYHILIAKPAGSSGDDPLLYASTGLPMFLEELYGRGARKENLHAIVAGGALVGTVNLQDLNLDIGGNTVDTVNSFLTGHGITIEYSETGGYFSCVLSFNLGSWEYFVEPIGQRPINADKPATANPITIEQSISRVRPIPQIALKVIRMIHSNKFDMDSIAKEIKQDQVLGAKIIKLSNSAYISPKREIQSIDQGLVILGEKNILMLTLSVFTELYFQDSEQGYSLCKGGLYHHALGTAFIADFLAQLTGMFAPGLAYTAGLLHDIGKTVLDQFVANEYPLFYRNMRISEKPVHFIEKEIFGITHTEAGEKLARQWSLPLSLSEVITYHHHPEQASQYSELCCLIHLADVIMTKFRAAYELEHIDTEKIALRLNTINLQMEDLPKIVAQIPWKRLDTGMAVFSSL